MHYKLMFPSKYLDAPTLQGRDVIVEIESVKMETLEREGGDSESKPVVRLAGKKKAWVLNKTNAKIIAKLHGNEVNNWVGKAITLYPTTCDAFGERVDCIRVRKVAPKRSAQPEPDADDWQSDELTDDEKAEYEAAERGESGR